MTVREIQSFRPDYSVAQTEQRRAQRSGISELNAQDVLEAHSKVGSQHAGLDGATLLAIQGLGNKLNLGISVEVPLRAHGLNWNGATGHIPAGRADCQNIRRGHNGWSVTGTINFHARPHLRLNGSVGFTLKQLQILGPNHFRIDGHTNHEGIFGIKSNFGCTLEVRDGRIVNGGEAFLGAIPLIPHGGAARRFADQVSNHLQKRLRSPESTRDFVASIIDLPQLVSEMGGQFLY